MLPAAWPSISLPWDHGPASHLVSLFSRHRFIIVNLLLSVFRRKSVVTGVSLEADVSVARKRCIERVAASGTWSCTSSGTRTRWPRWTPCRAWRTGWPWRDRSRRRRTVRHPRRHRRPREVVRATIADCSRWLIENQASLRDCNKKLIK